MKKYTSLKCLVGVFLAVWLVGIAQPLAQAAAQPPPLLAQVDVGAPADGNANGAKGRSLLDLLKAGGTIMYPLNHDG